MHPSSDVAPLSLRAHNLSVASISSREKLLNRVCGHFHSQDQLCSREIKHMPHHPPYTSIAI